MTLLEVFEATLIEINKVKAPSLLLEDFNYFINKAVQQYVNKKYNLFEINQQVNDDLRALKTTVVFRHAGLLSDTLKLQDDYPNTLHSHTYEAVLPKDYLHLLNCIVEYSKSSDKCNDGSGVQVGASRINSDQYPTSLRNYYAKPSWEHPYYFINKMPSNINSNSDNKYTTDINRIEIRLGKSTQVPSRVYIDYLQIPEELNLTQEQIDDIEDNSQIMQFPKYVCLEIINELVKLVLENSSDPRLQTNIPINQTIGLTQK